jgi:hypothetical protein
MSFEDYYNSPPEPPDLYEEICVKRECQYLNDDGECVIDRYPEDCAVTLADEIEACRDTEINRKIDERRMKDYE